MHYLHYLNMTKVEKDGVISTHIIKLNIERILKRISPTTSPGQNMAYYKALILYTSQDGFIINPYMDTHLSNALHSIIEQLKNCPSQLEFEIGQYPYKTTDRRNCQLCQEVKSEEQYICRYASLNKTLAHYAR